MLKKHIFNFDNVLLILNDYYFITLSETFEKLETTYNDRIINKIKDALKVYKLNYDDYYIEDLHDFIELYIGTSLPHNFVETWIEVMNKYITLKDETKVIKYDNKDIEKINRKKYIK